MNDTNDSETPHHNPVRVLNDAINEYRTNYTNMSKDKFLKQGCYDAFMWAWQRATQNNCTNQHIKQKEPQEEKNMNTDNLTTDEVKSPIYVEYYPHTKSDCFKIDLPWSKYKKHTLVLCEVSDGLQEAQKLAQKLLQLHLEEALKMEIMKIGYDGYPEE